MESLDGVFHTRSCDAGTAKCGGPISPDAQRFPVGPQDLFYDVEDAPLPASTGDPQAEPSYTDGSGALFSMYLDRAEEEDQKAVERWKGDADGILVFVRCRGKRYSSPRPYCTTDKF